MTTLATAVLAACGGGDGGSSAPAATKISGTAAVGAALGNATVQAKCASGNGAATTAADGSFTISIDGTPRPCVLSVKAPDGTTLHAMVEAGTGATATANITPLTELVTASLAQGNTNAFFEQFDTSAQARLTSDNLTNATQAVRLVLSGVVDLTSIDPLKDPLVAANGANAGNAQDKLLDQLGKRLESSKTTLAELSSAVASNAGAAAVQTALQPAAASCAGLKTGKYHVLELGKTAATAGDMDAAALQLKVGTEVISFTANASEACRFTVPSGATTDTMLVSKSGLSVVLPPAGTLDRLPALLIPAQALTVADLAGNWNGLGYERDGSSPYASTRVTFSLDGAGKVTADADCTGLDSCAAWLPDEFPTLTVDPDGGLNVTTKTGAERAYAFKGTDGQVVIVFTHGDGFTMATRQIARALPAVGAINVSWDTTVFPVDSNPASPDGISATTASSARVTAVDTQANTYTRERDDGRADTWKLNTPLNGLRYRAPTPNASEAIAMPIGSTGLSVSIGVNTARRSYNISVNRP
ncbi:hypothetical protein [Cupriavidus necator]|uniref:hypothetical protein n=1 Tax=Cupriavidus necator TaxID=106590 RepID=UPI003077A358